MPKRCCLFGIASVARLISLSSPIVEMSYHSLIGPCGGHGGPLVDVGKRTLTQFH